MTGIKVGDFIDGEPIDDYMLSGKPKLEAFETDNKIIVAEDKGKGKYKVLVVTDWPDRKRR